MNLVNTFLDNAKTEGLLTTDQIKLFDDLDDGAKADVASKAAHCQHRCSKSGYYQECASQTADKASFWNPFKDKASNLLPKLPRQALSE